MKRDMELVRTILRNVQDRDSVEAEEVKIDGYPEWVVNRHAEMLADAGLLQAAGSLPTEDGLIITIRDLTWEGHDFLAALADEGVWTKIKQTFTPTQLASMPLAIIKTVGMELLKAYALRQIGLGS